MADGGPTPFRRKLRKNADRFVKFFRGMSNQGADWEGSFVKNLNTTKSLIRTIRTDGFRDIEPMRLFIDFGLSTLSNEIYFRDQSLQQNESYNPKRWELVYQLMRLIMSVFDHRDTTRDFVPLGRSLSELNKARLAEHLFGQQTLERMQALALQTIHCLQADEQPLDRPPVTSVIVEATKVLRISSFKRDIGETSRRVIFELICKLDELDEQWWRLDATKYASHCSALAILIGRSEDQLGPEEPIVELVYNAHESARNRLIAFYEWSLSFGCPDPFEAKRMNVKNLLGVIRRDQDVRQVSVALELLSYLEFASHDLHPYRESSFQQLDVSQRFLSTQLIDLLGHQSELVRGRASQLLVNWCFSHLSPYSQAHRTAHLALTERITGECSPMVRLQFIGSIYAILLTRADDSKAKRRAYKTSVVQLIAHECVRTLRLVANSERLIRLLAELFYEFPNKLEPIGEQLTLDLVAIFENELQNKRPIGRDVATSLLGLISELAQRDQLRRFRNYPKFKSRTLKLTRSLGQQHMQLIPLHNRLQETMSTRRRVPVASGTKLAPSPLSSRLESSTNRPV